MQKATFRQLRWIKGTGGVERGIKGGRIPRNAIAGGNGTFVVTTPAELLLSFTNEDGRNVTVDIIRQVRDYTGWQRMNAQRVAAIEHFFREQEEFLWDEDNGRIIID